MDRAVVHAKATEVPRVRVRLVLGAWAVAIYAIYWMGYLGGAP